MNTKHEREKGQSLVEFALLLPLLILLMMGLLDFGRAYYVTVTLNDAAMEGAIYAGFRPNDEHGIKLRAASAAQDALVNITTDEVSVVMGNSGAATASVGGGVATGVPITVTVIRNFEFLTPFIGETFAPNGLILRGQATSAIISTP